MKIPSSVHRVPANSSSRNNERIRQSTRESIARYAHESRERIEQRLGELDQEWDIERALEANAAAIFLIGISLGVFANRKWLFLPAAVAGFLLQHAVQGWCPPVPLLRRLGVRTPQEIEEERYALKLLRGDFDGLRSGGDHDIDIDKVYNRVAH